MLDQNKLTKLLKKKKKPVESKSKKDPASRSISIIDLPYFVGENIVIKLTLYSAKYYSYNYELTRILLTFDAGKEKPW